MPSVKPASAKAPRPAFLCDACGHQRAPLSRGRLEGQVVECPLHFARFDVRTGALLWGPIAEDVPVYEVRVDGEMVYVRR